MSRLFESMRGYGPKSAAAHALSVNDLRQIKLIRIVFITAMVVAGVFWLRAMAADIQLRMLGLGVAIGLLLVAVLLTRWFQYSKTAIHIGLLGFLVAVTVAIATNGGLESHASGWLLVIPMVAGLLGGRDTGLLWSAIALLGFLTFAISTRMGVDFPTLTPDHERWSQERFQQFFQLIILIVIMLAYLTKVSRAETELLHTIEDLRTEVAARIAAEENSTRATTAKNEFLASMSHELRTPLNAIVGFSERLTRTWTGSKDDRLYQSYASINSNARILSAFVNDLMQMSRFETGRAELNCQAIELLDILEQVISGCREAASAKGIYLNLTGQRVRLDGDPVVLTRVFGLLVKRAVNTTAQGGVDVQVAEVVGAANLDVSIVRVTVKDSGVGESDYNSERFFQPYTDVNRPSERENGETGLEMALAYRFVKLHGGEIRINSIVDVGTVIQVDLPFQQDVSG